jgi:transcriptional regulator with XRE-family HTH domain
MMTTATARPPVAGALLRDWRERRRLSQLDLANLADTSTRHLSFVETGRSRPSRDMVLKLGQALQMPLSDQNQVLLAAGHSPEYPDARRDAAATRYLLEVLDLTLAAHDPWPALVLDAHFDVIATNAAVDRVMLHPRGLASRVVNYGAWRAHLLRQVRQHAAAAPSESLRALLAEAAAYPSRPSAPPAHEGATFALPLELEVGGAVLRMYSTIATFGTPLDVAASELAIETFLPADEATRRWFADMASPAGADPG